MRLPHLLVLCLASALLLQPASAALARPGKERGEPPPAVAPRLQPPTGLRDTRAPAFTADSAAREIQRRHGGRVLAVQPDGAGYRVKTLKDGEVRIYQVDP